MSAISAIRMNYAQWSEFFEDPKMQKLVNALVVEACANRDREGMKQAIEVQLYKYLKEEK